MPKPTNKLIVTISNVMDNETIRHQYPCANEDDFRNGVLYMTKSIADVCAMGRGMIFPDPSRVVAKGERPDIAFRFCGAAYLSNSVITFEYLPAAKGENVVVEVGPAKAVPDERYPASPELSRLLARANDSSSETFYEVYPYADGWEVTGLTSDDELAPDEDSIAKYGIYLHCPHTIKNRGANWIADVSFKSNAIGIIEDIEKLTGKPPLPILYR